MTSVSVWFGGISITVVTVHWPR